MATKYTCHVERCEGLYDESVALFSDEVPFGAMYTFADTCLNEEDVSNARIIDLDTGEVIYDAKDERAYAEAEREGMCDESHYDPFMGCDAFCIESDWMY